MDEAIEHVLALEVDDDGRIDAVMHDDVRHLLNRFASNREAVIVRKRNVVQVNENNAVVLLDE